jgi:hypothetical protein
MTTIVDAQEISWAKAFAPVNQRSDRNTSSDIGGNYWIRGCGVGSCSQGHAETSRRSADLTDDSPSDVNTRQIASMKASLE